jgi:hypothetical protein
VKKVVALAIVFLALSGNAFAEWRVTTRSENSVIGTVTFETFNDFRKMFPEEAELAKELVMDALNPEEVGFYVYSDCGKYQWEFSSSCETDMECVETYPFLEFSLENNKQ